MRTLFAVLLSLGLIAVPAVGAVQINGAGATFPNPIYSKWFSEYNKKFPAVQINYQPIGSGGGIRQFIEKTVDFGASDAPMTDEQIAKAGAPVIHVPTVLGAVVATYNLNGIDKPLKLTPDVLADIFLGKITKWNDARIAKNNPGVTLTGDILVVHRSDGSGTTAIFTDFLSKASPAWKDTVGTGTALKWPVGLGGKGNDGVAGLIKQTPGSIGYVELIYAESNKLPHASIQNKAGEFVAPSLKSVTAAAEGALKGIPEDLRVSIANAEGKQSYPISGFTYLLVWKTISDAEKGKEIVNFLKWALKDGQGYAGALHYAPLPKALVSKVEAKIATIEVKKVN